MQPPSSNASPAGHSVGLRTAIGLGSNLGNRLKNLRDAVLELRELAVPGQPVLLSKVYQTSPVDCPPGSPAFFNAAMEFACALSPEELLKRLQDLETNMGRSVRRAKNTPRPVDLDILYMGGLRLDAPHLCIPHPAAAERLFVLAPLADIAPQRTPPGWAESIIARRDALARTGKEIVAVTGHLLS